MSVCIDCGQYVSLCDHAAAALMEPERVYRADLEEELRVRLAEADARIAALVEAGNIVAGGLMLIRSADSLAEKDRIAFTLLNEYLNHAGVEPGSLTPDDARRALAAARPADAGEDG